MYPNFEEILEELSYKVGIVDLTNESHKQILVKLLRERGIDSAQQLTDRASVVFKYIKEATKPDKALAARSKESGKLIYFGSKEAKADALKAGTHTDPTQPTQQSEPTQSQKLSGSDFQSSAEKSAEPTPEPTATQSEPKSEPVKLTPRQQEITQSLNNGDISEIIKASDEVNDLRDRGIAGAGGSVPSYGEKSVTSAANEFKSDGFSNFKETNAEAIEVEKKNILANSKANARKVKEVSKQLGYKLPEDEEKVIDYIAQRKVWGDLELQRLKDNSESLWYIGGNKGLRKDEKVFRDWADASFDGAHATLHAVRTNSNIDVSKPFHVIQSNPAKGGADAAIYSHLQDKYEEAKQSGNADDIKHYEREIKAFDKLGFNDTMVIGKDKNDRTTVLHITNKKANELNDMWANTTPEYMLASIIKQFGKDVSEAVVTFAKDGIERCKDGKQATNRTFASMKIDENFIKLSETDEMKPYTDALRQHAGFNKFAQENGVDLEKASTTELLSATQQYIKSEEAKGKTVAYKPFGKVLTKVGEFAQVTKMKQKYPGIDFNSESVSMAVKNKNDEKDLVAAVHSDMVNQISKADSERGFPDKDGNNGPHTEAYIATVIHSMHFDLMVENYDGNLAAVTGIRDSVPGDFRGCLAELSGFKGDIESEEGRAKLNKHLLKQCKINATTGFIEITSPNGTVSLAEDSWRTSGESKKVEKKLGKGLRECVASKVDGRKSSK
jgi:hypothetical protein